MTMMMVAAAGGVMVVVDVLFRQEGTQRYGMYGRYVCIEKEEGEIEGKQV